MEVENFITENNPDNLDSKDIEILLGDVNFDVESLYPFVEWVYPCIVNDHSLVLKHLNVILLSDEELLKMNIDFLKHDYYTDILTFDLSDDDRTISGELYISMERVEENAKELGLLTVNELHRVIIHGILHLLGYDDSSIELKKEMQVKENQYLNQYVPRGTSN